MKEFEPNYNNIDGTEFYESTDQTLIREKGVINRRIENSFYILNLVTETDREKQPSNFYEMYEAAKNMFIGKDVLDINKLLDYLEKMNLYSDEIFDLFCNYDYYGLLDNKDFILKAIEKTGGVIPIITWASTKVVKQILQDNEIIEKILNQKIPNYLSGEENLGAIIYQLQERSDLSQDTEFIKQFINNLDNVVKKREKPFEYNLSTIILNFVQKKHQKLVKDREFFSKLIDIASYDINTRDDEFYLPFELGTDKEIIKKYLLKGKYFDNISYAILFSPEMKEILKIEDCDERDFNDILIDLIAKKIEKTNTIVTHFGDDLDNKSAIEALQKWAEDNDLIKIGHSLNVIRVPAGKIKEGYLNVDTGGHSGNRYNKNTVIIDGAPKYGVKSACESLSKLGIYVPNQIIELADVKPNNVSALDSRSGLALVRYLSGAQTFKLAEEELLDKTLSDEQLKKFGLSEAHEKQQKIIDSAIQKIEKYTENLPNGDKIVLSPEQILGGSAIAYEKGIKYYVSASTHLDKDKMPDGVAFAITCKPGSSLPEEVLFYGRQLAEKYKINENTSGVFVSPDEQMIVAGGPKNPEFKIPNKTIEEILNIIKGKFNGKMLVHPIEEIKKHIETINNKKQIIQAMEVIVNEQKEEHQSEKKEKNSENDLAI